MNRGVSYRKLRGHRPGRVAILAMLAAWAAGARAQESSAPASSTKGADTPAAQTSKKSADTKTDSKTELASRDTGTTFKLRVNVVQVRVVVRDKQGKFVEGLKREDFLLYDQGKLQAVTTFGVETTKTREQQAELAAKTQEANEPGEARPLVVMPRRFVALVFDDIHLNMQDATTVRVAAKKLIESMTPTDRIGIYGTSEQMTTEFTGDKEVLEQGLLKVMSRPKMGKINQITNCPDVNHYMADQYVNKGDPNVLSVVTQEVLACMFGNADDHGSEATSAAGVAGGAHFRRYGQRFHVSSARGRNAQTLGNAGTESAGAGRTGIPVDDVAIAGERDYRPGEQGEYYDQHAGCARTVYAGPRGHCPTKHGYGADGRI